MSFFFLFHPRVVVVPPTPVPPITVRVVYAKRPQKILRDTFIRKVIRGDNDL